MSIGRERDKGNELDSEAVREMQVPQDQTKMRSVREPRHTKTTCLMVSLVRKKGKYETAHGGVELFSDRIFPPSTALSEFSFTSLPLKPAYISFLVPEPRRLFYHSRVARKAICSTELFDSPFRALA